MSVRFQDLCTGGNYRVTTRSQTVVQRSFTNTFVEVERQFNAPSVSIHSFFSIGTFGLMKSINSYHPKKVNVELN